MYIRPKQLWWLVPIFITLFCLGAAIAQMTDKPVATPPPPASEWEQKPPKQEKELIAELLSQWDTGEKTSFVVLANEQTFSGYFSGASFSLTGNIENHQVDIKRTDEAIEVTVDGEVQHASMLPFSLFTPYDHVMLLKGQLQSIQPRPVPTNEQTGWNGYRFELPPGEVTSLLASWLGPHFPTEEVLEQFLKQIKVTYELWYDDQSQQLRQLGLYLQLQTASGTKQDQLLFQL